MNIRQLFARRPITGEPEDGGLRRALGPVGLTSLGVGAIIGAGIFVMTGRVAAETAGPGVLLSFVVAGVACSLAALCYAEFAAMNPVAGSAYAYAYSTMGELVGWIIGWCLILEYALAASVVAVGWSKYFNEWLLVFFQTGIRPEIAGDPFSHPSAWLNLPALFIVLLVTLVLVIGIRESAGFNTLMVFVKLGVVLFVIGVGWFYIDSANWTSVPVEARHVPKKAAEAWGMIGQIGLREQLEAVDDRVRSPFLPYGISGVFLGASLVFFAYIGFDSISTHAEEAKRPSRDVPLGILLSLGICTILYIAVAAVITGMEPYPELNPDAAVASAFRKRAIAENSPALRASAGLIATGALAGMTSVMLVTLLSQARVFRHPELRRPFRTPGVWLVAPLGVLVNVVLMLFLPPFTWGWFLIWLTVGLTIYFGFGHRFSVIGRRMRETASSSSAAR